MTKELACYLLPVCLLLIPACGNAENTPEKPQHISETHTDDDLFSAEKVMKAYKYFYPDRISELKKKNGDWAARIGAEWYYFADRKLLPERKLEEAESYASYAFYPYSKGPLQIREFTREQAEALRRRVATRDKNPPSRHPGFFNAIWQIYDLETSKLRIKEITFLGRKIDIHERLAPALLEISRILEDRANENIEVNRYITAIRSASAFNYRKISGTDSLSFHSYGIALDLQEKDSGGKALYWRWTRRSYPDWFDIPLEDRYAPPREVIETFEKFGFIWGGKWLFFDGIHFEYRPEILYLNGITVPTLNLPIN
jgi:hypothetical protein